MKLIKFCSNTGEVLHEENFVFIRAQVIVILQPQKLIVYSPVLKNGGFRKRYLKLDHKCCDFLNV
jgi:hypothetical protein